MDPNAEILDLVAEDHGKRVERRLSGEYRGGFNVSLEQETSHGCLDSGFLPASGDEMEIVLDDEDTQRLSGTSVTQGGDESPGLISTSFEITMESAHEDDESEGSPDRDSSEEDDMDRRAWIISQLQGFMLSFLRQLADCAEGKRSYIILELADRKKQRDEDGNYQARQLVFPRSTQTGTSLRGIATLFGVIDYIFEALIANIPATKRDIYYRDVALFKKQTVVDNLVDDIGATLSVERDDILVRASSKGLFCGSALSLRLFNGSDVAGSDNQPAITPNGDDIQEMIVDEDIGFILIVEKEAIFHTLAQVGFARNNAFNKPGIIITGKGYPDVATRQLVNKLCNGLPERIPILGLVDPDPFGVEILACYAFGSEALHHQREGLVAERTTLLGVCFSELEGLGISREALLPLTENDKKKIDSLLARADDVLPGEWKDELKSMSDHGAKAEIEVLCMQPVGGHGKLPLVSYLEDKMQIYF